SGSFISVDGENNEVIMNDKVSIQPSLNIQKEDDNSNKNEEPEVRKMNDQMSDSIKETFANKNLTHLNEEIKNSSELLIKKTMDAENAESRLGFEFNDVKKTFL
ncbi:MAG: hypothetical protein MHPSP_004668, partial [Paramarteilia canceri]